MFEWLKTTTVAKREQLPLPWFHRRLVVVAFLLALTAGFFWRITLTNQYTWLESPDLARQVLPWFQMQVGEIQQGRFPLWDPFTHTGQPLLGQAQPGAAYPLNWLLFLTPTRDGWIRQGVLNWYYVLIHFMAVAFAYWLCRDWGCTRRASVIGGVTFGMGGYMGQIDWPQMLNGCVWAPAVLLFVSRCIRGEHPLRNAALGGACLGTAYLSGHHQVPIFITLMAVGIWLWAILRGGRIQLRFAVLAAIFLTIMVLVGGLQSVPGWEYSKNAYRWVGAENPVGHTDAVPYNVHRTYSLHPQSIFGIVFPNIAEHVSPYLGFVSFFLACLAVLRRWDRLETRLALFTGTAGLLFAFGENNIFHGILYSVLPVLDKARTPAMAVAIFSTAAAPLIAIGADTLRERNEPNAARTALWLAAGLFGVIFLYAVFRHEWAFTNQGVLTGVAALLFAGILAALARGSMTFTSATGLILALVLFELGNGPVSFMPHREDKNRNFDLPRMAQDKEIVEALRKLDPYPRVDIDDKIIPHNFGDWNGVDTYGGYLASLTKPYWDNEPYNVHTREFNGVRYFVGKEPRDNWKEEVYSSEAGWKIFRNPGSVLLVRTVHDATELKSDYEVKQIYARNEWDYHRKVFFREPIPPVEQCAESDELFLLRRQSNRFAAYVEMSCRGVLLVADNLYPGWEATVDGVPTKLYAGYTTQRAVVVDKGRHLIEMRFRPASFYAGLAMSVLGLALTGALVLIDRRIKL